MNEKTMQPQIKDVFDYVEGSLIWRARPDSHFASSRTMKIFNTQFSGKIAGTPDKYGYVVVNFGGRQVKAHRLIWEMHNGAIPKGMHIDHINGVKNDNRISNLRLATMSQNLCNRTKTKLNVSGFKGVSWSNDVGRWRASIVHQKKCSFLGHFDTAEEAFEAYCTAAIRIHGQYARTA
jgi:hypothetical protein